MKGKKTADHCGITVALAVLAYRGPRFSAPGQVHPQSAEWAPAFSEFKGYEGWQTISSVITERCLLLILGTPAMIDAYKAGVPGKRQAFPRRRPKWRRSIWNAKKERIGRRVQGRWWPVPS